MARKADIPGRIIDAALDLAAREGWKDVSLGDIATEAGLSMAQVYPVYRSKSAVIGGFVGRIDEMVLAGGDEAGTEASDETVRDRLFDVLMRRFDALVPHKAGVAAILKDLGADPCAAVALLPRFMGSMAWMLEAAGLSSAGLAGAVRTEGLAIVYGDALRVWLRDDTKDMSKTMAALDRGLRRADRAVAACCALTRRPGRRQDVDEAA